MPSVYYYGDFNGYKALGISYFEGIDHYNDFYEMNDDQKKACKLSVEKLQRKRVVHGDLEAFNFILSQHDQGRFGLFQFFFYFI